MAVSRSRASHVWPTWLPKLIVGLDRCEWKTWFQVHHDGKTWEKLESEFDLTRYNIEHTELLRLCTEEYEQRGFTVTVERQNDFKVYAGQATISGRPDLVALRDGEAVIVDAKAAKPNPSHEIQVMLYMNWLPLLNPKPREAKLSGEVYYGEEAVIDIPASRVDERFKEITAVLIGRVTSKTPARKASSASECRFCPISSQYSREDRRIEQSDMQPFYVYGRLIAVLEQDARACGEIPWLELYYARGFFPAAGLGEPLQRHRHSVLNFLDRRGRADRYLARLNSLASALENGDDSTSFDSWCGRYLSYDESRKPVVPARPTPTDAPLYAQGYLDERLELQPTRPRSPRDECLWQFCWDYHQAWLLTWNVAGNDPMLPQGVQLGIADRRALTGPPRTRMP